MSRRHIVKSDFSASTNLLRICGYRRTTVLELLRCVDRGANVNFPDREDCGRTPLIIAVSASCRTTVEWLMRNGADVNKFDFLHFTPLHHAVQTGNLAIVEMLARAGALIDSPSVYNWTPLLYAVATFRPDTNALAVIRCLVSFGADVTHEAVFAWHCLADCSERHSRTSAQCTATQGETGAKQGAQRLVHRDGDARLADM
jgi:ankyrin repeat protein